MESDENEVTIFFRNGENEENFAHIKKKYCARARKNISKFARKTFDKKNVMITELV